MIKADYRKISNGSVRWRRYLLILWWMFIQYNTDTKELHHDSMAIEDV